MSDNSGESIKNPMLDKFYRIPVRLNESDLEISDTDSVISKSVKSEDTSNTVYLTYTITGPENVEGAAGNGRVLSIVMYEISDEKPTENSKEYITGNEDTIKKFEEIIKKEENVAEKFTKLFGDLFDIGEKKIKLIKDDKSITELSGKITETTSLKELDEYLKESRDDNDDVKSVATVDVNKMLDELLKVEVKDPAKTEEEEEKVEEEKEEEEGEKNKDGEGEGEGEEGEKNKDGEGEGEGAGGQTEVTLDMDAFNTSGLKGVKMYSVNDEGETEITKLKVVGEIAQMGGKSRKMKKMKKMQSKKKRPKQTKRGGKKAVKQSRKKK